MIVIATMLMLVAGCSTKKNTSKSRFWHSFTARYNTYFNGSQAFLEGTEQKEKGHKDNYTEMLPLYTVSSKKSQSLGSSQFDRAIEKMEKAIKQHSIKAKPEWNKSRRKTEKDREWLAGKLLEPKADDAMTARQKADVKESLYRALDEVKRAKRGETTMMTEEEVLEGLKAEGTV